ncbi:MAG TPA: hypothetical protein VK721_05010 [Solirubrobacteraceae bacterium]|jgi:hypothetical protein|nr:hypothetical protein [Solirubrobacteraceae bacterium]
MPPVDELSTGLGAHAWTIERKQPPATERLITSPGLRYRLMAHAYQTGANRALGSFELIEFRRRESTAVTADTSTGAGVVDVSRALDEWPRFVQAASVGLAFLAAILAAARVVSAAAGLAIGFLALATLFFGSFAAYRRGSLQRLFGPNVSLLGLLGSLIIFAAICVNLVA